MSTVETKDIAIADPAIIYKGTLIFKRRPWVTGKGYELRYDHWDGSRRTERVFQVEADADAFAKENSLHVTHRVILTDAEMREADRKAILTYGTRCGNGRRRYSGR